MKKYTTLIFLIPAFILFAFPSASAQTNTATITQSGWYRIAKNGPLVEGEKGGNRAAAQFILKDATGSLHQTVTFLGYIHFGRRPSIVILNNSYHGASPPFAKLRIVTGGIYDGAAIDVYVHVISSNNEAYFLQDNVQASGWQAVDWELVSTQSGDNDGVPTGFTGRVIGLKEVVKGFVGSGGKQVAYTNGNFYTSGNILIGKTSQQNTAYKVDVNGIIRADKVVVNSTGADFVFDSAYQLRPLDAVARYIGQNGHLPDVPSAATMQQKGLDVGENQTRLLQKIEELTLYLIDQEKRLTVQQERLMTQQQQIQQLQKAIHTLTNTNENESLTENNK